MCPNKLTIRLREEIEAIKGGVSAAAEHLGRSRNTIYNWFEKGNAPTDQVEKLGEIGVDTLYVFTGVKSSDFNNHINVSHSYRIQPGLKTYANSDVSRVTKAPSMNSGGSAECENLDDRFASVIDVYIRDDILTFITTMVDQILKENNNTLNDDTKARLVAAAMEGRELLSARGRSERFTDLIEALVDAALIENNI